MEEVFGNATIALSVDDLTENGIEDYDQLKAKVLEDVSVFKGIIISEDNLDEAPKWRAELNKKAKRISDFRIAFEKDFKKRIEKSTSQLKELASFYADASSNIDVQVKEFDEKRKQEKNAAIGKIYADNIGDMVQFLPMPKIFNEKWLNKGYALDAITKEIKAQVAAVEDGIKTIQLLGTKYESQMISAFLEAYNMNDALKKKAELEQIDAEMERRRKAAEEEELRKQAEEQVQTAGENATVVPIEEVEEPKETVAEEQEYRLAFEVYGNKGELTALCNFIRENGYRYNRLP
jgi:hypothetical protein